jgi:MSHA type pilus biogenesis protein MshL
MIKPNPLLLIILLILLFLPLCSFAQDTAEKAEISQQIQAQEQAPPPAQEDKISLDIKGMDIVDVLKTLAMRSGLNIVVGKNVMGKVTIFLKDVKPRQALDIILLANDLAYDERDGIINVMSGRDYETIYGERFADKKQVSVIKLQYAKAISLVSALNQMKSNIGRVVVDEMSNIVVLMDTPERLNQMRQMLVEIDQPTQTRIFDLNYSNSEKLKNKINEMLTKNIGSITIDERTNKLIVVDYPQRVAEIAKVVEAFDDRTRQVLIDSKIVEVTLSDKLQLGIDWDFWIKKNFRVDNTLSLSLTSGGTVTLGTTTLQGPDQYKTVLDILKTYGDTRVLSSPRVTALNNEEAKILVGTKDAYITQTTSQSGTGSTITAESVNFVDVGIQLFVTPTINREGFVTMKIKPVVSSAVRTSITSGGTVSQIPIVSTSEAETSVMVKDGATIIIAGLIKDETIKAINKIPILGDIPFLGNLFKNTSDEIKKKELVIFLTPHILSGPSAPAQASALEFEESIKFMAEHNKPAADKIRSLTLDSIEPRLNEAGQAIEINYGDYLLRLRTLIAEKSRALAPQDFKSGQVEVAFVLTADGRLLSAPEVVFATDDVLREYALKAVVDSSPFPPFPKELVKEKERFDVVISYSDE